MDTQANPQPSVDYTIKKPWEEKKISSSGERNGAFHRKSQHRHSRGRTIQFILPKRSHHRHPNAQKSPNEKMLRLYPLSNEGRREQRNVIERNDTQRAKNKSHKKQ